jgi:hypothetical protein
MAEIELSAFRTAAAMVPAHQRQLFALISTLIAPRTDVHPDMLCRVLVDGSLPWQATPLGDGASVLQLAQPVAVQRIADCLLLTAR